jgi:hypothetical protein
VPCFLGYMARLSAHGTSKRESAPGVALDGVFDSIEGMRAEPSHPVSRRGMPLGVASAVLSVCLSPIIVAPLALEGENLPSAPQVQWFFFLVVGALFFWRLGRPAGPPVQRLRTIAAFACAVLLPLRAFWVNATLLVAPLPESLPKNDWGIEDPPQPLAAPYVYLFAVVYLVATVAYFARRSARTKASARPPSGWSAALVLLGFVQAVLTAVQLGLGPLSIILLAPISFGVAWCPIVSALVFGRELWLAAGIAISHRCGTRFLLRTSATAVCVGALCAVVPVLVAWDLTAPWRVFSRTSGWHFSTIPIPEGCYQWN